MVCAQVRQVTHDVKTFILRARGPRVFRYEPGQFVTLTVGINGQDISRCYTISSPPTRPNFIAITVKRQHGGVMSNWMHDHVRAGTELRVQGPLGTFTLSRYPSAKYLFLSGGSGITPLMSMTRALYDLAADTDVLFVHSARTPSDIIFRAELSGIAGVYPGLRVTHICESDSPGESWPGLRGRLDQYMLQTLAPDLQEREVFTCGPAPYMAAVRDLAGINPLRYHEESFDFDDLPGQRADARDDQLTPGSAPVTTYAVEFTRSARTIRCGADETILDAALDAGMHLPFSCTEGMCGTCKCTLTEGSVDMHHNGGIRPREIAQNKILPCCSMPLTDLVIDA
ncbi:hybrid-cluster NAD(P)-dependent oxidoreductase [Leekyejoonella antrihumi]|uniref:Hybrid-cluster NAD(P)-dependent oxidoreductase n=1 Tax=Leekyejoonella antrihumi TaxID=1660198 RepID=A0A563DQX0_9MICO|nr:hybrid-cluster NAD(P)-dependent oxidoreductase [Leekyejoonella antrihumi]